MNPAQPASLVAHAADHRLKTGRPFVTLTWAQSLDGCIAINRSERLRISSPESMRMTYGLRAHHQAILVGIGTVLADNPKLRTKEVDGPDPQPVFLDSLCRTPPDAAIFSTGRQPWIACAEDAPSVRRKELESAGALLLTLPRCPQGGLSLTDMLNTLGALKIDSLMVEGGSKVLASFLRKGLGNLAVLTLAPIFVGGQQAIERLGLPAERLPRLREMQSAGFGPDLVLWGLF